MFSGIRNARLPIAGAELSVHFVTCAPGRREARRNHPDQNMDTRDRADRHMETTPEWSHRKTKLKMGEAMIPPLKSGPMTPARRAAARRPSRGEICTARQRPGWDRFSVDRAGQYMNTSNLNRCPGRFLRKAFAALNLVCMDTPLVVPVAGGPTAGPNEKTPLELLRSGASPAPILRRL